MPELINLETTYKQFLHIKIETCKILVKSLICLFELETIIMARL